MNHLRLPSVILVSALASLIAGCEPEIGSKAWCEDMQEKPKGDWTLNEATQFAKHCVLEELKSG